MRAVCSHNACVLDQIWPIRTQDLYQLFYKEIENAALIFFNFVKVSDDEDDTHPNIDTPSLFRWRHQARVERMEEMARERKAMDGKLAGLVFTCLLYLFGHPYISMYVYQ